MIYDTYIYIIYIYIYCKSYTYDIYIYIYAMNLSGFCAGSALTIPVDAHSSPL